MKISPPEHLKPFIHSYDILEWKKEAPNISLPAWTNNFLFFKYGDVSDVVLLNGKKLKGYDTMVTGCMTYALIHTKKSISAGMIAVELKPMTFYYYLQKDVSFLTNNSFYADKLFPGSSEILIQIKKITDTAQRIEIINGFLTNIFQNIEYAENTFFQTFLDEFENTFTKEEKFSLKNITDKLDISDRNYRRVFQKIIGVTPKLYYRIKRLENILSHLHEKPDQKYFNLLRGYADQSHFIKDFIRFTGKNPKELQKYFLNNEINKIYNYL